MTNLGGHDLPSLLEAFEAIDHDRPVCFIAYTIKGFGLPLAGHKDNHAGLLTPAQMEGFRAGAKRAARPRMGPLRGPVDARPTSCERFLDAVPFNARRARAASTAPPIAVPDALADAEAGRDVDAAGLRADPERARALGRAARRPHRHDLARRHRLDQSRRLGEPARPVRPRGDGGPLQGRAHPLDLHLGLLAEGPAYRARHRRDEPVPPALGARPVAFAVRRAAAPDRHALRPVHRPRPRCAELRLLPGRPLHPGRRRRRA